MSVPRWLRVLTALSVALVLGPPAAWAQQAACSPNTTVNAPAGSLCGITKNNVTAYTAIPFGQPPVGNLRWKNPQPVSPWSGTLQAIQSSSGCLQPQVTFKGLLPTVSCVPGTSEDCLYLNVWMPAGTTPSSKLPVMVFIYGGAFLIGSDAAQVLDGSSLASSGNVIVVNFNYRLGSLGFLAMDGITDATNNNFGFRDQILALQWVQTNIASFGGDPTNVTIFGESAGAMSVGLHALSSSQSSGLFKAAIMESNPLGMTYMTLQQAQESTVTANFAAALGCPASSPASCVQGVSDACTLVTNEFQPGQKLLAQGPSSLPWAPVVDGTLIRQQPMAAAAAGALKLPMLLGTNLNEGNAFSTMTQIARESPLLLPGYTDILTNIFGSSNAASIQSQSRYACTGPCGPALANVINDYVFACANRLMATQAQSGIYAYQFTLNSGKNCNPWPQLPTSNCANQSCHGAEVPYVFNNPKGVVGGQCTFSQPGEQQLSNLMGGYWTSFARQQSPVGSPSWPSFQLNNTYMVLDTPPTATVDPWVSLANCSFWDQIGYPPQKR